MEKMKTLTIQGETFEVVDEQARTDVANLENSLIQNTELTDEEIYELKWKLKFPNTKKYIYLGDCQTDTDYIYGFMCAHFTGIEDAMAVEAQYSPSPTQPNALSELIAGISTACRAETSSLLYRNILPRITLNYPVLVAAGVKPSELHFYQYTSYNKKSGPTYFIRLFYDSEEDIYTLYRYIDEKLWLFDGVLQFNSNNQVLVNHMAAFDDSLSTSWKAPSAKIVGEKISEVNTKIDNLNQGIKMTDTVTGTNYLVTITNGQLVLTETTE